MASKENKEHPKKPAAEPKKEEPKADAAKQNPIPTTWQTYKPHLRRM